MTMAIRKLTSGIARPGRGARRRYPGVLVQHHRRARLRQDDARRIRSCSPTPTPERPALYFTVLGEPPLKMLRYQQQFAFFDVDEGGRVGPLHQPRPGSRGQGGSARSSRRIVKEVEAHRARRSSSSTRFARSCRRRNRQASDLDAAGLRPALALHLTSWQATTFLVGEYQPSANRRQPGLHRGRRPRRGCTRAVERNSIVRKMQVDEDARPGAHSRACTPSASPSDGLQRLSAPAQAGPSTRQQRTATRRAPAVDRRADVSTRCWAAAFRAATRCSSPARRDRARPCSPIQFIAEGVAPRRAGHHRGLREAPERLPRRRRRTASRFGRMVRDGQLSIALPAPARSLDRRDARRDARRGHADRRQARRDRFALGFRARARADVPRGLPRVAVSHGRRAHRARRHGDDDGRADGRVRSISGSARTASRF